MVKNENVQIILPIDVIAQVKAIFYEKKHRHGWGLNLQPSDLESNALPLGNLLLLHNTPF